MFLPIGGTEKMMSSDNCLLSYSNIDEGSEDEAIDWLLVS